jgi:hypothetical protein
MSLGCLLVKANNLHVQHFLDKVLLGEQFVDCVQRTDMKIPFATPGAYVCFHVLYDIQLAI